MDTEDKQAHTAIQSDALERLRDRTDELELIISSLTIFALFSLPGWMFDSFSGVYTHLSTALAIAGTVGIAMLTGVCYGLAVCFVVHLMARAYWVGLIGLRTVFPDGINWSKTPGIGPLTRQRHRANLPDLDTMILRTDRLASSLFAVISLLTLSMLWFGTIMLLTVTIAGEVGGRFGLTNTGMGVGALLLVAVFAGLPALLWFMDALLAARIPRLQQSRIFVGFVKMLGWATGIVYPRRLILPVQLTLQSNTRPVIFYLALMMAVIAIAVVGNARMAGWQAFTLSGEFTYLSTSDVASGFRSTYYEDMPSAKDHLRAFPRIDSFNQTGSFVRLFLPYQPLRDNLVLDQLCTSPNDGADPVECLRQLWAVSIDNQPVSMAGFDAAERMDIGMRGLIGLVPLAGLSPGRHTINVEWNPNSTDQDVPIDDRYTQVSSDYVIHIAFAPGYELQLD
jgi:hypothetical protein